MGPKDFLPWPTKLQSPQFGKKSERFMQLTFTLILYNFFFNSLLFPFVPFFRLVFLILSYFFVLFIFFYYFSFLPLFLCALFIRFSFHMFFFFFFNPFLFTFLLDFCTLSLSLSLNEVHYIFLIKI